MTTVVTATSSRLSWSRRRRRSSSSLGRDQEDHHNNNRQATTIGTTTSSSSARSSFSSNIESQKDTNILVELSPTSSSAEPNDDVPSPTSCPQDPDTIQHNNVDSLLTPPSEEGDERQPLLLTVQSLAVGSTHPPSHPSEGSLLERLSFSSSALLPQPQEDENTTEDATPSSLEPHNLMELEAPILNVMDRIEDEVEAHTYEDLVPLDVKLALEDKVFGWTHLTSSFLGHTIFTIGSYSLVFEGMTLLYFQLHPDAMELPISLQWLRAGLSLWAAFVTFRMVRRRRRIWFRAPYGSKAYKQDEVRRRQSVQESDRYTTMGRMMQAFRHRRVLKRLKKAERQFAKKHSQTKKQQQQQQQENHHPQRQRQQLVAFKTDDEPTPTQGLLSLQVSWSDSSDGMDSTSDSLSSSSEDEDGRRSLSMTTTSSSTPTSYEATSAVATLPPKKNKNNKPSSSRKRRPRRSQSFMTRPTKNMQSFAHDQILFPVIHRMPYAHGGFFGAAPFLLANPHWISILRHLMPDVYVEISRRVAYSPASKLIHWAENNPVVAAYGAAHDLEYSSRISNLEWDVFLDPLLVARVQVVLDEQAKFLNRRKGRNTTTNSNDDDDDDDDPNTKHILKYYQQELEKRSQALVDKMLIAHGNLTQIIVEQTGQLKHFNYSRIKRTRRTLGGGIYARQWMAVFAEALKLGVCYTGDDATTVTTTSSTTTNSSSAVLDDSNSPRAAVQRHKTTSCLKTLTESSCPETTMAESIRIVEAVTKEHQLEQPIGFVLDLKSRHVPKRIWSLVVDTLRASGVRVEGIASFFMDDIRNVSCLCQSPVQEINFFHSAGDFQLACHEGKIQRGGKVFFNAGCLLWNPNPEWTYARELAELQRGFDPQAIKASYRVQPFGLPTPSEPLPLGSTPFATLQQYKEKFDLSLGMYCQEFAVDEAAVTKLVEVANRHKDLYDLGFSWGGINGITIQGISPGRFTATDGFWNQRYIGHMWDYNLKPDDIVVVDDG